MAKPSAGWIVALVGCGCILPVIASVLVCGGIFGGVMMSLKGSEPYARALEAARADPEVMAAFGGSIEPGTLVSGNISIDGQNGAADMSIPISGPGGDGSISVKATKIAGQWTMERLLVVKATGERWDLLGSAPPVEPPRPEPTP